MISQCLLLQQELVRLELAQQSIMKRIKENEYKKTVLDDWKKQEEKKTKESQLLKKRSYREFIAATTTSSTIPLLLPDIRIYLPPGSCYDALYEPDKLVFTRNKDEAQYVLALRQFNPEAIVGVLQAFVEGKILLDALPHNHSLQGPLWTGHKPLMLVKFFVDPNYFAKSAPLFVELRRIMVHMGGAMQVDCVELATKGWVINNCRTEWEALIQNHHSAFQQLLEWFVANGSIKIKRKSKPIRTPSLTAD
jgi:hypothetical protein